VGWRPRRGLELIALIACVIGAIALGMGAAIVGLSQIGRRREDRETTVLSIDAFVKLAAAGVMLGVKIVLFVAAFAFLPPSVVALALPAKLTLLYAIRSCRDSKKSMHWCSRASLAVIIVTVLLIAPGNLPEEMAAKIQRPRPDSVADDQPQYNYLVGSILLAGNVLTGTLSDFGNEYAVKDSNIGKSTAQAVLSIVGTLTMTIGAIVLLATGAAKGTTLFSDLKDNPTALAVVVVVLILVVVAVDYTSQKAKLVGQKYGNSITVISVQSAAPPAIWAVEAMLSLVPKFNVGDHLVALGEHPTLATGLQLPFYFVIIVAIGGLLGVIALPKNEVQNSSEEDEHDVDLLDELNEEHSESDENDERIEQVEEPTEDVEDPFRGNINAEHVDRPNELLNEEHSESDHDGDDERVEHVEEPAEQLLNGEYSHTQKQR